jgi:hypothetical protein
MKYAFLVDNYRDLIFYEDVIKKDFIPVNIFWDNQTKEKELKNEINIYVPNIALQLSRDKNFLGFKYDLDHDFILEFYYKMYNNNFYKFGIDLMARINYLYPYFNDLIKENDIVISTNSGCWFSRLLCEICKNKNATFYFFENFFFRNNFQISKIPFTNSKYGFPELNRLFYESEYNNDDIDFYYKYIKNRISKYEQEDYDIEKDYDIFIVGQIPDDTNVILLDKPYKNSEELCYQIAKLNPHLNIIYKLHPLLKERGFFIDNKVLELENVFVTTKASIHNIFNKVKEVYTISSTVGIEAQLFDKKVKWFSDTTYKDFNLEKKENTYKFINACRKYMFELEDLWTKIK